MNNIRLTKIFRFETAHALHGYDGKCKNIHGHSYTLHVTIIGQPIQEKSHTKCGMVMDFGDLKEIVNQLIVDKLDHALLLNANSPHVEMGKELEQKGHKIIFVPYQPTCENMLVDFAEQIQNHLPEHVKLAHLKLYETANSYGEWRMEDNI